jgi:alanine dehydrogenase
MDGTVITAARTAAGSALATRLLARSGIKVVAILGTGVQARAHARALVRLPDVRKLRIAGRDSGTGARLVGELRDAGIDADAAPSIEDAVRGANGVCATTRADTPVLRRGWLRPGTHVNSVGYTASGDGEVDQPTIAGARVFVESRAAVLPPPPSGPPEIRIAIERAALRAEDLVELGEVSSGRVPGRLADTQLTLYKSVGVAVQNAAAAALVLGAAQQRGCGTCVEI